MPLTYLINQLIEFRPHEQRLINKENNQLSVQLPAPATRCLQLLVESRRLVTQAELYQFVWGEAAASVSPNSLYQNISLLRKALRKVTGCENHWVVTSPRKGFHLDSHLEIETLSPAEDKMPEIAHCKNKKYKTDILLKIKEKIFCRKGLKTLGIYTAFMAIFSTLLFFVDDTFFPQTALTDTFVFFKTLENCNVFINKDALETTSHMTVLSALNLTCKRNHYVYITAYPILHSATVMSCNMRLNTPGLHCISRLIREFR